MPTNKSIVIPLNVDDLDFLQLYSLNPSRYPFLLQSVAQSEGQSSYDILFACPQLSLELTENGTQQLITDYPDRIKQENAIANNIEFLDNDFLRNFDQLWRLNSSDWNNECNLPFCGGWFLYLGYELSQQIEPRLLKTEADSIRFPIAVATRIPAAVIRSHEDSKNYLVVEEHFSSLIEQIQSDIDGIGQSSSGKSRSQMESSPESIIEIISEDEPLKYLDNVSRIKEYIKDGDVFQVNLSRQWYARLHDNVGNGSIFKRLKKSNPAPFSALADFGDKSIISSSPERLVKVQGRKIDTRPIAGTRPRGNTVDLDQENLDELIAHPKERAEHIMLIDLERNDLGRVCEPGSVTVNELMVLETYSHVHHIVSNVQGKLKKQVTPSDVIRAVFPGGTITGCPKVRCMEIIAELEQTDRGPYTGSLGYVNHSGDMDLNILIRTLVKQGNQLSFRAGAGIVADSIPEKELEETRAKAKGLLLAL